MTEATRSHGPDLVPCLTSSVTLAAIKRSLRDLARDIDAEADERETSGDEDEFLRALDGRLLDVLVMLDRFAREARRIAGGGA